MIRFEVFLLFFFLLSNSLSAMIIPLSFSELVESSELIVLATVEASQSEKDAERQIPITLTTYSVSRVLKGPAEEGEKLKLKTFGDEKARLPESPAKLEKGRKAILFLLKNKSGDWVLNNLTQGLWPIDPKSGETLGMGFNYSIEKVEKEIKSKNR